MKIGAAAIVAGTQLKNTPNAEAKAVNRIEPDKKEASKEPTLYDWTTFYQKIGTLSQTESNPDLKKILEGIRIQAGDLEPDFETRAKRTARLIELTRSVKDPVDGQPKLIKYAKQLIGNMTDDISPEDVIPFFGQKRELDQYFRNISALLDNMARGRPLLNPDRLSSLYSDLYQTLVYGNELFPIKTAEDKRREKHDDHYDINLDPQITTTPKGQQKFIADKKAIERFLQTYPYFKRLYTNIQLGSSTYGINKGNQNPNASGTFYSHKVWGTRNYRGEVYVNMDHANVAPYWTEQTFAHEAFGHGADIEINLSLQDRLDESQVIERLAFQYEILNNPDWGGHDESVPQLFKRFPVRRNNHYFIQNANGVTSEQLLGLASEYPRNIIFFNALFAGDYPQTIYDSVMNKPQPILSPTQAEPKKEPPKRAIPTATPGYYPSMDSFLQDYRPKLEEAASQGNDQAKIILWGLKKFKADFENYDIVWDPFFKNIQGRFCPTNDKSAATWSNFFNNIVLNTTLYHVFLNKDDNNEIQGLFSADQKKLFRERVLELRKVYRWELWAESNGYTHLIGDRMAETPPARVGLAHLAAQISTP